MFSAESLVCAACQSTLFSRVGFHTAWTAQSSESGPYTYSVRMEDAQAKETFVVKVEFRSASASGGCVAETPVGLQTLHIEVNEFSIGTRYYVYAEPSDIASKHITSRATTQVHPEEFFEQARESLRACTTLSPGHENCVPPQTGVLPTRVIDCEDPSRPKLHFSRDERAFYGALSFVWGEDQPHKTTSHNIDVYTAMGLDPAHMPQTILDAIAVVKALGLRFLWVDAYCIIQDDPKDKQKEIAKMRRCAAYIATPGTILIHEPVIPSLADDPVNSRAWCLEELLLSPRALIFSRTLQYSCVSQSPTAIGGAPETHENTRASLHSSRRSRCGIDGRNTIVGEYTRRDLTHEKDRLIAIGAVAEEFGRFWKNSEYVAGVWRHNLLEDLLWSKQHIVGGSLPGRPAEYRAPTWSWASVNCTVLTAEKMNLLWPTRRRYLCEVIRCEATLRAGDKSFGQVTGMFWSPANSTLSLKELGGGMNIVTRSAYLDCDEEASQADRQVYALPIRCCEGSGFGSIEGILVVPSEQLESNYRRIGSFVIGTLRPKTDFDAEAWIEGPRRKVSIV
ncbi:hypothetical protein C8R45DRAFT_1217716 [Mycena sanguinolenta]|nr:hypothetical protein C8R45DRAFT_1217716 [Mycena sanguinolenta]